MRKLPLIFAALMLANAAQAQGYRPKKDTAFIQLEHAGMHDFKVVHIARPKQKVLDEYFIYDSSVNAYFGYSGKMDLKFYPKKIEY